MDIQVFYVNRGDMLLFDLSMAMDRVRKLQEIIERELHIPIENQVLLMSGGGMVSSEERVCSYTSGKDSCPMFLFNLKAIEEKNAPEIITESLGREGIRLRIEGSMNMAPTLVTLSTRTQLALELKELSLKHEKLCKELVHHQHLQHQGWCTVVANFEDCLAAFLEQADLFVPWYQRLLEKKAQHIEMLESFPKSCHLLAKMPILSSLTAHFTGSQSSDTLLKYCTTIDNTEDILADAESAHTELMQMTLDQLDDIVNKKEKALESANQEGMKEVKGLEKRLHNLQQLIVNAGQLVKTQIEYAEGFANNQKRCRELADPNILPDLCMSHKQQLKLMEREDQSLRHIVVKCQETKRELCENLHTRLRWIMYVQKLVSSLHHRIYMQYSSCNNLKLRLERLEQIYRAPTVYSQLCVEVCRRRNFFSIYKSWSQEVYDKSTELHQKEVKLRKEFLLSIGKHFLREFFPGLDRVPPAIVSCPISELGISLPMVSEEEITSLRQILPELTQWLRLPDDSDSGSCSPSQSQHSQMHSPPCASESPSTHSDIAVLTPRTNQSSQSSVITTLSPTISSSSLTMKHIAATASLAPDGESALHMSTDPAMDTATDAMESAPLQLTQAIDVSNQSVHMMAMCEQFSGDELSDEERAPTSLSLNDENSGGFMTANFYLADGHSSPAATDMVETITVQNNEIEKLMSENAAYKQKYTSYRQKCDSLKQLLLNMGTSIQQELQGLRKTNRSVRQDVSKYSAYLKPFQNQILDSVQEVSAMHQDEIDRQVVLCQSAKDAQISDLNEKLKEKELENSELLKVIKTLEKDKDILHAQVTDVGAGNAMEIESTVQRAELELRKRLTLEHELELDQMRSEVTADIEAKDQEFADKKVLIESLQIQITDLNDQRTNDSAILEQQIKNLKLECVQTLEKKVAELNYSHENEKKALSEQWECKIQEELRCALVAQRSELEATYMQQIQGMAQSTVDVSTNTDEDYLYEEMKHLQQENDADKEQALAAQAELLRTQFEDELEVQKLCFVEQSSLQREGHEQEFEYRASTMRESLQLANEMRLEEKLAGLRKEKDSIISELKWQLSVLPTTGKRDTATVPPPAATVPPPAATVTTDFTPAASGGTMAESVVPIPMETSVTNDRQRLEEQLQMKENLIKTLQSKVIEFEMSASSQGAIQADKVTVKSCVVGDKVILCYDEKHEHYIVFSLSNTLHFVHTDCLKDLGLEATSPEQRKSWVLAEILDKEYCMARKPTNRFKVPVNTKFYRVKAKPWSI